MSWDGGKSLLYPNPHSPPLWHTMVESGMGGTPLYVTLTLPAFASPPAPAHQTNKHLLRFPSFSRYIHPSTPLQTKLKLYQSPIDTVSLFIRMMKAAKCLLGLQLLWVTSWVVPSTVLCWIFSTWWKVLLLRILHRNQVFSDLNDSITISILWEEAKWRELRLDDFERRKGRGGGRRFLSGVKDRSG